MIIFYVVLRQNEFSFIVKQSTQPALFLLDAHRKLLPFINFHEYCYHTHYQCYKLQVCRVTVKTISVAVDADDVTWSLQSPSRDESLLLARGVSCVINLSLLGLKWGERKLVCILLA